MLYCVMKSGVSNQGRNQELANRAIAPTPKFLQTWWRSRTPHEKIFHETVLPLKKLLLKTTFPHTYALRHIG